VFLRDFGSTNGTFVNDQPVKGEIELKNDDLVKVGPIEFKVQCELPAVSSVKVNEPTPLPVNAPISSAVPESSESATDDDSVADLLMSLVDDGTPPTASGLAGTIPEGSTVMDVPTIALQGGDAKRDDKSKAAKETTADAARSLLERYMKGKRV
jgi:hypothetical protein